MKKFLIFTAAAAMLLSLAACTQSAKPAAPETPAQEETMSENNQIPNPWTECASEAEAAQLAGFDLTAPDAISGVSEKSWQVMNGEDGEVIFEIDYTAGEERAAYVRKAPGADDVSGDYNEYDEVKTVEADGVSVTMKGTDGLVNLAVWTDGGCSYALHSTAGLSGSAMAELVSQIG